MQFQIGFYLGPDLPLESSQELITHRQIFYLAEVLSYIMAELHIPDPTSAGNRTYYDNFELYLKKHRKDGEKILKNYTEFFAKGYSLLESQGEGALIDLSTGQLPRIPSSEDFDPDARALVGKIFLSDQPIKPDEAQVLFSGLIWLGAILKRHIIHCEHNQSPDADHYQYALNSISTLANYAIGTIESGVPFVIQD